MLHPIIRWLARRAIRWFYRDAEILNAAAIPSEGATLIVASHGNDLTDILMTFLLSKRDILFVANMAAADSPIVRWTYAGLGVIPVSRVRDARALKARGEDVGVINTNAFLRVVDALKTGHAVAIFPEGNVNDAPHLGPLRSGAAKMALQAVDSGVDLTMIAVGYQYESPTTPRSGLL
ncbi:MAG: 1-acyl-sn-glycerol-3-phosphate acyltransferase, partial [Gemmatimonadaceae bacterium]